MIVNNQDLPARLLRPGTPDTTWRCLARRGMLHSECEAFEQIRLAPGTGWTHEPDHGTEVALYVVAGRGAADDGAEERPLDAGSVLLVPARSALRVTAGPGGLNLAVVRVLPGEVTAELPARVPELPAHEQTAIFRPEPDGP
ncbi:hypothetical protein [Streptomyces sp. JHA26]|uniref:hypothetical protein n=1 Tax=Streptomyces sp. JHA26 TaxID=1917143 RepID=UPI00098A56B7|nr:hypothetical protein [Streptomyces sp. JHA26]